MKKSSNGISTNQLLVLVVLLLVVSLSNILIYQNMIDKVIEDYSYADYERPQRITGRAGSEVTLCINTPPQVNYNNCNSTIDEDKLYDCQLLGNDTDNDTVTFSIDFITPDFLFNVTTNGSIIFTPSDNDTGMHIANLTLEDDSNCSNSQKSFLWEIQVTNVNEPPYLNRTIPDVDISPGVTTYAFNLNDHFKDPDGDTLSYTYLHTASSFTISISSTGVVWLYSTACGSTDTVVFFAADPGNLSANSNVVRITVACASSDEGGTGGGAGGGGGSAGLKCKSKWVCHDWGECQKNGTRDRFCEDMAGCTDEEYWYHEECTYYPPKDCTPEWQCGAWIPCQMDNSQTRDCVDINFCDDKTDMPESFRNCLYMPTCFDNVQNGDETGVDCGGPCEPCSLVEQPKIIIAGLDNLWIIMISILIALLFIMLVLYKLFHKEIKRSLVKIGWKLAGRYIRVVLLNDDDAEDLLTRLKYLEKKLEHTTTHQVDKRGLEMAALTRLFFEKTMKIPYEFREIELLEKLKLIKTPSLKSKKLLQKIFTDLFRSVNQIEFNKRKARLEEIGMYVQELIQMIYVVSKPGVAKYTETKQKKVTEKGLSSLLTKMANLEIVLQYGESQIAKNKFLDLLEEYEKLSEKEKAYIYPHMERINDEIKYVQGLVVKNE